MPIMSAYWRPSRLAMLLPERWPYNTMAPSRPKMAAEAPTVKPAPPRIGMPPKNSHANELAANPVTPATV